MTLSDKLREVMAMWKKAGSPAAVNAYEEYCGALVWKHGPDLLRALGWVADPTDAGLDAAIDQARQS